MLVIAALVLITIALAAFMRHRRIRAFPAVAGAALVFPLVYAFGAFVYPADPEMRMWAMIAVPVSFVWGLVSSGIGYGLMALVQKFRSGEEHVGDR